MKFRYLIVFIWLLCTTALFGQRDDSKYPDLIAEAYYSGYFDVMDSLYGGQGLNFPVLMDVNKILGRNKEKWFVSLPKDSYIIFQYTDNEIIDAPGQPDIKVIEHGCCNEWAEVHVSHDGKNFEFLGLVDDCDQNQLDLADIGFKLPVRFVKITGVDVKCASPGFDLVSVWGLPGANRALYAGMDEAEEFFEGEKSEKILILENVYFETDKYEIQAEGITDLNKIIQLLKENPEVLITVSGHTDAVASEEYNLKLSINRANAVEDYFLHNGIHKNRIQTEGFGESVPLKSNENEAGRAINRRVEIRRRN